MLSLQSLWRRVRLLFFVFAMLIAGLVAWAAWMLTDQRYQQFVTQQLGELLDATVQIRTSHLTLWRGIGISFEDITVRERTAEGPFFTAEAIAVFLDLSALLHGQFDFQQILVSQPTLQVIEGVTQEALIQRVRRVTTQQHATQESDGWFSPRFIVQRLTVEEGMVIYRRATSPAPLVFSSIDATYVAADEGAVRTQVMAAVGERGELGSFTFHTRTAAGNTRIPFAQWRWQGEVTLTDARVQRIGQSLGTAWPQAIVGFAGQFHGQWAGPVELSGRLTLRDAHLGTSHIRRGSARVEKLVWRGADPQHPSSGWASVLSSVIVNAHMQNVQGTVEPSALPLTFTQGAVTWQNQTLTVTDLQGRIGESSHVRDGTAIITRLSGASNPTLALQLSLGINVAKDAKLVLAMLPATGNDTVLSSLVQAKGYVLALIHIDTALGGKQPVTATGEVTLRDVALPLPNQDVTVTNINGAIRLTPQVMIITSLTGRVGDAPIAVQGKIHNYRSNQRAGELRLTFSDVSDQTVATLFPKRLVLPNTGTFSGTATVTVSPGAQMQTAGTVQLRGVQLDPLTFLRPFTVAVGELHWQGQRGTFRVTRGRLVDFAFTGHGRFSSMTPLRLAVSLDFPTLNVKPTTEIDEPRTATPPPTSTTDITANITCGVCAYDTAQATNLRLAVHWHDRQADVDVTSAQVVGGTVTGEVTVWPDLGALYFAPKVAGVNVQSFFQTVGVPPNVLTGTATGNGKVYVEDWRRWAHPASWDAVVSFTIADGVARRVPILVRLWSALSLQSLVRWQIPELPSDGLSFSTLTGDLAFGRGLAVTKNVILNGSAVRIEASGEIRLQANTLDLLVQVALLHGITSTLEWVPLVGDVLARGTDLLTTLPFRVTGPYAAPTVTPAFVGVG